ncbi:MAG: AIR synthase-related protein, partial [Saprospiraceae bacterium]
FYNQYTENGRVVPVYPTPTIGMLGLLDDWESLMTLDFKNTGDIIYLIGTNHNDLGSSEYLREVHSVQYSPCPHFDLEEEYHLQAVLKQVIKNGLVQSTHDVSDGGLLTALLESAMPRGLGFAVTTNPTIRKDAWLFGEAQSRVIVSVRTEQAGAFERFLADHKQPHTQIGTIGGNDIQIDNENWGLVSDWKHTHDNRLSEIMN